MFTLFRISLILFAKLEQQSMDEYDAALIRPFSVAEKKTNKNVETEKIPTKSIGLDDIVVHHSPNEQNAIAIIFNHSEVEGQKPRDGTNIDKSRLTSTLTNYRFNVRAYDDRPHKEITNILYNVSMEDHTNTRCLFVIVMSHGEPGKICAQDEPYSVEELWNYFTSVKCPGLINKPKVFMIQACRGTRLDPGVRLRRASEDVTDSTNSLGLQPNFIIPTMSDMLFVYSTFDDHYSWRNPVDGSWFIQTFCTVLNNAYKINEEVDLYTIFTRVLRRVAMDYQSNVHGDPKMDKMTEMPCFVSTLKRLYFLKRN